jgi:hypothetical protein
MTLEENIRELRDGLAVTSTQTLLHEKRLKEHQQWMEDMERAFVRMAALDRIHSEKMAEFDQKMTQVAAAQLLTEEKLSIAGVEIAMLGEKLAALIDSLRKGSNGHQ